jgi:hydrogenase nickel incorporation protein HypA/HybF
MHELSIAQAVVEQIEQIALRERASCVETVTLSVGALSGVDAEALRLAFPMAAEGTLAQAAGLVIETVRARLKCRDCGRETDIEHPLPVCPACGAGGVELVAGRELLIESVELSDVPSSLAGRSCEAEL